MCGTPQDGTSRTTRAAASSSPRLVSRSVRLLSVGLLVVALAGCGDPDDGGGGGGGYIIGEHLVASP